MLLTYPVVLTVNYVLFLAAASLRIFGIDLAIDGP